MKFYPLITFAWAVSLGLVACAHVQPGTVDAAPAPARDSTPQPVATLQLLQGQPTTTTTAGATRTAGSDLSPTSTTRPASTPTALVCLHAGGRYEAGSLRDPRLKLPLEYSIYLPPCYDALPARRYPVLYLIHGQSYTHDQWDRLGVDETMDALVASGELPPFLIVLPRDRSWAQPTEDPFGQVLVEKLVPTVDQQYRTQPERSQRAVGGLSRGAGWAIHLGLSHWEMFGAIGGHSPPVFWADTSHIRAWLGAIPTGSLPRIYLDIGEKDRPAILESARWFETLLTEEDIPHVWHLYTGYHEEAYWARHVDEYLRWYAAGWQ